MTSLAVSPIFHNMDNLFGMLKRGRLDSDYGDLDFIAEMTKRRKIELTLGNSKEARFTEDEEKPRSSGVTIEYLNKCLGSAADNIDRLRNEHTDDLLLNQKKLHLVLDLDHTLLNSTFLDEMSPEEEYLKTQTQFERSRKNVHFVDTPEMQLMTKLRPYILTFLAEADQMFELSVYTMGSRDYALEMVKLLDPTGILFGGRIVARSDSTDENRKALDVVHARESAVVILDDTKDVWTTDNQKNVITMQRYHFFKSSCQQFDISNTKSYSELKTDEWDQYYKEYYLKNVLQVLRNAHRTFFSGVELQGQDLVDRDVRLVLKNLQKEVLKGCKIVFSHIYPSNVKADTHPLWKTAEQLGATCSTQVDPSVTHVVAADARTQKSCWAVKEKGKFLVNPQWIHTAKLLWKKPPEKEFPVNTNLN